MAKLLLANPRKRRRSTSSKKRTRRSKPKTKALSTVRTTKTVTRRRNPAKRQRVGIMGQVQNAAIGAGGALAVDIAMAKLPFIPANLKVGPIASVTKGAVAVGIGMLVGKFGKNKKLGVQLAEGGMTVAFHDAAKSMIGPKMGLGEYEDLLGLGDYSGDLLGMGAYDEMNAYDEMDGMNAFEQMDGMGDWTNAAMAMESDFDL